MAALMIYRVLVSGINILTCSVLKPRPCSLYSLCHQYRAHGRRKSVVQTRILIGRCRGGVGPPKGLIASINACALVLFDKVLDKATWQIYPD